MQTDSDINGRLFPSLQPVANFVVRNEEIWKSSLVFFFFLNLRKDSVQPEREGKMVLPYFLDPGLVSTMYATPLHPATACTQHAELFIFILQLFEFSNLIGGKRLIHFP